MRGHGLGMALALLCLGWFAGPLAQVRAQSVPSAPTITTATAGDKSVSLGWSLPASTGGSAITDYRIEYNIPGNVSWIALNDGTSTTRSYNVVGLENGTRYAFRVKAVNANGTGPASASTALLTPKGNQTITFNPSTTSYAYGASPVTVTATASSGLPVTLSSSMPSVVGVSGLQLSFGGIGTSTITASQPGNAAYNAATTQARVFTVTPKPLTISQPTVTLTKEYDGTLGAWVEPGVLEGVLPGDTVTVTATASYASAAAGTGKTVTVTYALSGASAGNYTAPASWTSSAGVITKKPLSVVNLVLANKPYDRTTTAITVGAPALGGVLAGDTVTLTTTGTYDSAAVGTGKTVTMAFTLGGTSAANYAAPVTQTFTDGMIVAKALSVTGLAASSKTYNGNTAATLTGTAALSGVISGDTVTLAGTATGVFSDKNIGTNKVVNVSGLTLGGASASNYILGTPTLLANITAKALTMGSPTVTLTKVYDRTTNAAVVLGALSGVLTGEDVAVTASAGYSTAAVGSGKTVTVVYTLSGANAGNYTAPSAWSSSSGSITAKALTASNVVLASKVYDRTTSASFAGTPTLVGVMDGDTVTLTASGTYSSSSVGTGKTVTVTFALGGSSGSNYSAPASQTFTSGVITAKVLTVGGLAGGSRTYNGGTTATVSGTPTLGGVISGDTVTFTWTSGGNFSDKNVGTNKSISATGLTLTGTSAANYTYAPISLMANITPKALTIETPTVATKKVYDGTTYAAAAPGALSGVIAGDSVTVTASAGYASAAAGTGKTITVAYTLGGTDGGNYSPPASTSVTSASITAKPLSVSNFVLLSKEYDALVTAKLLGTPTLNGVIAGDTVTVTASGTYGSAAVGTGKTVTVTFTLGGASQANYSKPPDQGFSNGEITRKNLTINSLTVANKTYDGTVAATVSGSIVFGGKVGTEDVTVSGTITGTFSSKDVGTGKTVTLAGFTLGGADRFNYAVPTQTRTANITARALTIGMPTVALTKVYDGTVAATVQQMGAVTGLIAGDSVIVTASAAYNSPAAGTGKTVAVTYSKSGADSGNYQLPSGTVSFAGGQITKRPLSVEGLVLASKPYDGTTRVAFSGTPRLVGVAPNETLTFVAAGTYDTPGVGTGKAVVVNFEVGGATVANYELPTGQTFADGEIVPRSVPVTGFVAESKVYDGTISAVVTGSPQFSGVLPGETITVSGVPTARFVDKHAGSGKPVIVTGLAVGGPDAASYSLEILPVWADITPKTITVGPPLLTLRKRFDGTTNASVALGGMPTGVLTGDQVTVTPRAGYETPDAGVGKAIWVVYELGGLDGRNYSLAAERFDGGEITVVGEVGSYVTNGIRYNTVTFLSTPGGSYRVPEGVTGLEYLVVGGGGGGGFASDRTAGGGGGGAVKQGSMSVPADRLLEVRVGEGGVAGRADRRSGTGGTSVLGTVSAAGGGGGGAYELPPQSGGNGGGTSHRSDEKKSSGEQNPGGQGYDAGIGWASYAGGGGGGAGGVGGNGTAGAGGAGGSGLVSSLRFGVPTRYGGGGGGGLQMFVKNPDGSTPTSKGGLGGLGGGGDGGYRIEGLEQVDEGSAEEDAITIEESEVKWVDEWVEEWELQWVDELVYDEVLGWIVQPELQWVSTWVLKPVPTSVTVTTWWNKTTLSGAVALAGQAGTGGGGGGGATRSPTVQQDDPDAVGGAGGSGIVVLRYVVLTGEVSSNQIVAFGKAPDDMTVTGATGDIQWQMSEDKVSWINVPGATGPVLPGAAVGALKGNRFFRAMLDHDGMKVASGTIDVRIKSEVVTYELGGVLYHSVTFFGTPSGSYRVPEGVSSMEYLVVGGGGGGGYAFLWSAGGGGGGAVRTGTMAVPSDRHVRVEVGLGGRGGGPDFPGEAPADGGASRLGDVIAEGGGRGGDAATAPGSGVTGGGGHPVARDQQGGEGLYRGGDGRAFGDGWGSFASGGGGGSGGDGQDGSENAGGAGGNGVASSLRTGVPATYGGGGGGGFQRYWMDPSTGETPTGAPGMGGPGGGGAGGMKIVVGSNEGDGFGLSVFADVPAASGEVGTGGGGGGGAALSSYAQFVEPGAIGAAGGSGLVVIRYAVSKGVVSGGQVVPRGGSPEDMTLTGATGQVQWQVSLDQASWSDLAGATNSVLSGSMVGPLTADRYFRALLIADGVVMSSGVITVGVRSMQAQALTFSLPGNVVYGEAPQTLMATASSGLPVSYEVDRPGVIAILNGKWVATGAGVATITASQSGSSEWHPAEPVQRVVTVLPKPLIVGAPNLATAKVYDATRNAAVMAGPVSGVMAGDEVVVTASASYDTAPAGTGKTITVMYVLGGAQAANYTAPEKQAFETGVIERRQLAVTGLSAASREYDGTGHASITGPPVLAGVVGEDVVTLLGTASGAFPDKHVGASKTVTVGGLSLGGASAGNYTLALPALTADITARALAVGEPTVTLSKVYDGTRTVAVTAGGLTGVVAGDAVSVTASGWYDTAAAGTGKTVTVTYALGGADAGNYTAPLDRTFTAGVITAKAMAVSGLAAVSRAYDGTTLATITGTPVLSGVVGGDEVSLAGAATGEFADKDVGVGKAVTLTGLSLEGGAAGNYMLALPALTADVTARALAVGEPTVTLSKVYDGTRNVAETAGGLTGVVAGGRGERDGERLVRHGGGWDREDGDGDLRVGRCGRGELRGAGGAGAGHGCDHGARLSGDGIVGGVAPLRWDDVGDDHGDARALRGAGRGRGEPCGGRDGGVRGQERGGGEGGDLDGVVPRRWCGGELHARVARVDGGCDGGGLEGRGGGQEEALRRDAILGVHGAIRGVEGNRHGRGGLGFRDLRRGRHNGGGRGPLPDRGGGDGDVGRELLVGARERHLGDRVACDGIVRDRRRGRRRAGAGIGSDGPLHRWGNPWRGHGRGGRRGQPMEGVRGILACGGTGCGGLAGAAGRGGRRRGRAGRGPCR